MARVYLLLGSNVNPERNLPAAVGLLRDHGLVAVSAAYETVPIGTDHPAPFLNAAAVIETLLTPAAVKRDVCGGIERALGRARDPDDKNAPRTIDLDIGLWGDAVLAIDGSPVPDPDILRHLHAARPLADLAPALIHPVDGRSLADIAADLERRCDPRDLPRHRPDRDLTVDPKARSLPMNFQDTRLPDHAIKVGATPSMTEDTVVAGLLRKHLAPRGKIGYLVVESGALQFVWDDDPGNVIDADNEHPIVIAPERYHHVVITGSVRFRVEFYQVPQTLDELGDRRPGERPGEDFV